MGSREHHVGNDELFKDSNKVKSTHPRFFEGITGAAFRNISRSI